MYDWLNAALKGDGQIVTANRRLARILRSEYGEQQAQAGHKAWRTPAINSYQDWLTDLLDTASNHEQLPTHISKQQSTLLWEGCIRQELPESLPSVAGLVSLSMDAWTRLHQWCVPVEGLLNSAQNADQRLFARAARRYQATLDSRRWIDDASRSLLLTRLIDGGALRPPTEVTLVGFDRIVPQVEALLHAIGKLGTTCSVHEYGTETAAGSIYAYENRDAELRAAGSWALERLQEDANRNIAIVATGLEQDAERAGRLVLEGLVPGWQYGSPRYAATLNVSYGRRLSEYPGVRIALLTLQWLARDLSARDISLLLRTPLLGRESLGGRTRLELNLRQLPDRNWSPQLILRALGGREDSEDAIDWLSRVSNLHEQRKALPRQGSPAQWAEWIDDFLRSMNWPGEAPLDSAGFQLVNRWRELLNDFARLELVRSSMTFSAAISRLQSMAADTVYQPEVPGSSVSLMGPLEAAGMEFDELWIVGLSASNWPPPGRPTPLLSRALQRQFRLPDAEPAETTAYARRVLQRLARSTHTLNCSYPLSDGDAEQTVTTLIDDFGLQQATGPEDVGWHASSLLGRRAIVACADDPIPTVAADEVVAGGAATIQKQLSNPFAAFAAGRLGIRYLPRIEPGLAANLRGNLIHDSLQSLYESRPSQGQISAWNEDELEQRIHAATGKAFARQLRHADSVLYELFALERARVHELLRRVVALDIARDAFAIDDVEGRADAHIGGIELRLRYDRVDRVANDALLVLDYKTGTSKRFLQSDGRPADFQLVVYACTLSQDIAGLGLVNIDSRAVDLVGAGTAFNDDEDWQQRLGGWKAEVRNAAEAIARGDVRVNARMGIKDARPYAILSRYAELRRDI